MEQVETARSTDRARSTVAEHRARALQLVAELQRMAADTDSLDDRVRFRRSADSLIRLATAYRS